MVRKMVIGIRDAIRRVSIAIVADCAVLVCTMFWNFYLDIQQIADQVQPGKPTAFYTAQVATAKVVCLLSGGCLFATAVVLLVFEIRRYVDSRSRELGILKALGYSSLYIARYFWVFGLPVLVGGGIGYLGAWGLMPWFYQLQNKNQILPEIGIYLHVVVPVCLVVVPAVGFGALAVAFAGLTLRKPALSLMRGGAPKLPKYPKRRRNVRRSCPFLTELRRHTLRSRKLLAFFVCFGSFCFSAMTQMSTSMLDLSSAMMGGMMLMIGWVLATTSLYLAISTIVRGNRQTIRMMRILGYPEAVCIHTILGGYRPLAYLGFLMGTIYQYALLRIMVDVVFREIDGVPTYTFDVPVCLVSLMCFGALYEGLLYGIARHMQPLATEIVP